MSKADFDKFVRRQQAEQEQAASFDPKQQLQEWRHLLDLLYKQIRQYMVSYVADGTATIALTKIELNEEFSGPYTVEQMKLQIGASVIVFKPIGTMLIGSKGRVDVQGPRGIARLGLVNKNVTNARQQVRVTVSMGGASGQPPPPRPKSEQIEWTWKIITPPPDLQFIDLTQDAFFEMILSIADA